MRLLSISRSRTGRTVDAGLLVTAVAAGRAYAITRSDPGAAYEALLRSQSRALYGFGHPLDHAITGEFSGPGAQAVVGRGPVLHQRPGPGVPARSRSWPTASAS